MPRPAILPRTSVRWHLAIMAALGLVVLLASPAAAHERRQASGYSYVVGFGDEPAYAGEKNSVQMMVSDGAGKPVRNADGLKVMVLAGGKQTELKLEPYFGDTWGTPGDYRAFFIPTTPGAYTFKVTGTLGGKKVDQSYTSGKDGFDEVTDPAEVQYPAAEPTGSQLTTRLDRETARINAALAAEKVAADDQAASARRTATIGLVLGALGLLAAVMVGVLALRRRS
jgi:hypothetical protein